MSELGALERVRAWLREPGLPAYLWTAYLGFLLIDPYFGRAPAWVWLLTWASIPVFLVLYISAFSLEGRARLWIVIALAVLGAMIFPVNTGAMTYFIFGAAFIGYAALARRAYFVLAGYAAAVTLYTWLTVRFPGLWFETFALVSLIGIANIALAESNQQTAALRRANEEIERLAKLAERERIARDLHDVLGHTLSVIVLKSELASRLAERDPARAADEIRAVEQIAREALADVRNAVAGYKSAGIGAEIDRARAVLASAGVALEYDGAASEEAAMTAEQERVASLAIREAVTNVVRHAHATHCRLTLAQQDGSWRITIDDDGVGARGPEGNGLAGMRERIEAIGGRLTKTVAQGTQLVLELPSCATP